MKLRKKISEAKVQVIAKDYVILSVNGQDTRLYVGDKIEMIHQVTVDGPGQDAMLLADRLRSIGFKVHEDLQ